MMHLARFGFPLPSMRTHQFGIEKARIGGYAYREAKARISQGDMQF
jgi:hypothetical protein